MALFFTSYSDSPCCGPSVDEQLLAQLLRSAAAKEPEPFRPLGTGTHPVDVFVAKDAYELRADAPGVSSDNVSVEVHEGVLTIAASTSKPTTAQPTQAANKGSNATPTAAPQQPTWQLLRRERVSNGQRWSRSFVLPDGADVDNISVALERGVLSVHVPVRPPPPKPQPRRFAVNSSPASKGNAASQQPAQQDGPAGGVARPSSPPSSTTPPRPSSPVPTAHADN